LFIKLILNNMMKKLLFPVLFGAMTMFAACEADPCKDLDGKCGTGTCFEGTCVCDEGYEPDAAGVCNDTWAKKFAGSYTGQDVCPSGTYNLNTPAVVTETAADKISISNFAGFASVTKATVVRAAAADVSATKLDINDTDPAGRKFVGTATISGSTISGSYTVTFPDNTSESCTFSYTK
jgi:hypothetical protein